MTHPLDQLAPFVDGTLDPTERAVVDEHLRSCSRCRGEADAAGTARAALRALPAPLSPDLAARFAPEHLARLVAPRASSKAPWSKLAPVLAAAAVVALVALVVPRLGDGSNDAGVAADGIAEAGDDAETHPQLELIETDYDVPALQDAATAFAASYTQDPNGEAVSDGALAEASPAAAPDQARIAGPARTARAVGCLEQAFPGYPGEIVRVQRATFEGTPVFIAYVLESPGADTPPNAVSVWVAVVEDCSILTFSSARIE
ncbi:MAG: zf-HC2 domain-containing protein [Actinomycetota bacterium]